MRSNPFIARAAVSLALASALAGIPAAGEPAMSRTVTMVDRSTIVPFDGKLFDGRSISVAADGTARISTLLGKKPLRTQRLTLNGTQRMGFRPGAAPADRDRTLFELAKPLPSAYSPHDLIVVFKDGTTITSDRNVVPEATLRAMRTTRPGRAAPSAAAAAPRYTTDDRLNALFAKFAVSRTERLFAGVPRATLTQSASRAASRVRMNVLNLGNAFRITVTNTQQAVALRELAKMPNVAYAGRDYHFASMAVSGGAMPAAALHEARELHPRKGFGRSVPASRGRTTLSTSGAAALDNYTVTSSGQAFLNAPGVDAIAAFDEIAQNFNGQLPGTGVTITNVSLGDLDDASALSNPADPCNAFVAAYGPTTRMIGAQRYLDLPSMPLIPAYTAAPSGTLSGNGETCGMDPFLQEVGLDFSVMAPLPHSLQRPGEMGEGLSDLLGIAPGASYRLVVPAVNDSPSLMGAVLGAAMQSPAPDVITMSVGWGMDRFGFPGRYFEDDALGRSVAATVVNGYNIPLFIASNDGTRAGLWAPIGPSGGSAPTNVATAGATVTTLDDVGLTTGPSVIPDTGAIAVGGTTLDDIVSANPRDPANAGVAHVHAFPETRFNGFNAFSSGFGSRVNVSAPSDNILTLVRYGPKYDSIVVDINGGTSASAPEAAAVAAIAIQVARLQGHPFTSVAALRSFLTVTGTPVTQSAVADVPINVGPQVSARRVVEALLTSARAPVTPSVGRVSIAQRKDACAEFGCSASVVLEYTDPAIISLRLPQAANGSYTGLRSTDYLTIAPDWENLPSAAQFRLTVAGRPNAVLASTPFARLLPAQILSAAGLPFVSSGTRTVSLTYESTVGLHVAAKTTFDLTFGPADGTSEAVPVPVVPALVTGSTMPVSYDTSMLPAGYGGAYLTIWLPNHFDGYSRLALQQQLANAKGTVSVPVSVLAGSGVYIIDLWYGGPDPQRNPRRISPNAFARVSVAGSARPPAPLLGTPSSPLAHSLEIPYAAPVSISWDVSNVPNATGAITEVSFGAPNVTGNFNTFNNPNGDSIDAMPIEPPSVYHQAMNGVSGTMTLDDARRFNVFPGILHSVRVLATNGGRVIGEASDTSAFMMDGVVPPDGGTLFSFGLNTAGSNGLLMSEQAGCLTVSGLPYYKYTINDTIVNPGTRSTSTAMAFDQKTLQITNPAVVASTSCDSQPMVFANDVGLVYDGDARAFATISGVSTASPSVQFPVVPPEAIPNDIVLSGLGFPALPQSVFFLNRQEYVGGSSSSPVASFFGLNSVGPGTLNHGTAFAMDLSTQTPTTLMNIDDFLGFGFPAVWGSAYDPTTNTGYYGVFDTFTGDTVPVTILAIDYTRNSHSTFSSGGMGVGTYAGQSFFAIDPGTQKLLVVNDSVTDYRPTQFHIIDLKTKSVALVSPPQYPGGTSLDFVLVDPINHLFIMFERARRPDQLSIMSVSGFDVFDESGNLVKHVTIPYLFFPYWGSTGPGQQLTYVNGNLRRVFIGAPPNPAGVFEPQLMVFDY